VGRAKFIQLHLFPAKVAGQSVSRQNYDLAANCQVARSISRVSNAEKHSSTTFKKSLKASRAQPIVQHSLWASYQVYRFSPLLADGKLSVQFRLCSSELNSIRDVQVKGGALDSRITLRSVWLATIAEDSMRRQKTCDSGPFARQSIIAW